jgi:serine/threonine-protein kinase RsbW
MKPGDLPQPVNYGGRMKRHRSRLKLSDESTPWVSLDCPNCLTKARQLENIILSECEKHRFSPDNLFAIRLALEEAIVNAVKHGNKLDPAKHVRIQYHITDQRAAITIEDQGTGFNPTELADPTADENLSRCCGRGILLMRNFMTSVIFNPAGNKVTLIKDNEAVNAAPAALG